MANPSQEDALVMDARFHFDTWLNDLPQINEPDEVDGRCDCNSLRCVVLRPLPFNTKTPTLIELPCGCQFRKDCAQRFFGSNRCPRTRCPACESELFLLRTVEEWILDEAEEVEIASLEEEDRICGICRLEYSAEEDEEGQAEQPLKLPCQHVFGDQCIKLWLSAGSKDPNRRSCPICREGVVYIVAFRTESEDSHTDSSGSSSEDE